MSREQTVTDSAATGPSAGQVAGEPAAGDPGRRAEQWGSLPSITLPKGGGAIRGIGEKFATNPVTGAGSLTVPIATSRGRNGFGPELSLSYSSGSGNGPFGLGWTLSLPTISRKTELGLPRYADSDVFVLTGAEDLVPVTDGQDERDGYRIDRFRPRVERDFSRIERWTRLDQPGDVHWRTISATNVWTLFGLDAESRIADPDDPSRIFSWLICESRDDKGNGTLYRYQPDDGTGIDLGRAHERNRGPRESPRRQVNRYLKRILYGNRQPLLEPSGLRPRLLSQAQRDPSNWMFELVLDYGDHDPGNPAPVPSGDWVTRPDPFSVYRAGFEIRTTRLCRRLLMFHHFPGTEADGVGTDCLVRATELQYRQPPRATAGGFSVLAAVTHAGFRRVGAGYRRSAWPAVEFGYSEPTVSTAVEQVPADNLADLPVGLDDTTYRWIDLHGEGVPGVLSEQAGAWFYTTNLTPAGTGSVAFAPTVTVRDKPVPGFSDGAELVDLAGDGHPDLVLRGGPAAGLFEHDEDEGWQPFRPFRAQLGRNQHDPNLRFVDLDGDGHADILLTEDDALVWYPSLAEEGFSPSQRVLVPHDDDQGPRVMFADADQSIYLADLSGDGLSDLVRVRNGEVCYWPNLGYGRFGAKITMDNAPWLDRVDRFDQRRVRLADIDGSGAADLIYLGADGVQLVFNQSGNGWSEPLSLPDFPALDDLAAASTVDLLGNGTVCLVWSSSSPTATNQQFRYVNLLAGGKPHLLTSVSNNLGAETRVSYAPSTAFYLRDRVAGQPWRTRLPFPVHVVERTETYDWIGRSRFTTRYAYHHGYFDGDEREFRGFGEVEHWDTEERGTFSPSGSFPIGSNEGVASDVPAVHTKRWFHLGRPVADLTRSPYEQEYFREPGLTVEAARALLATAPAATGLTPAEEREAQRALKSSMLRQEVYADDAGATADPAQQRRAATPYTVTDCSFAVRLLQQALPGGHAVCWPHPVETLTYHYEREAADPRVQQELILETDDHGLALKEATIALGRRAEIRIVGSHGQVQVVPNPGLSALSAADQVRQTRQLATFTQREVTPAVETSDDHRLPVAAEEVVFELTGFQSTSPAGRLAVRDLVEADPARPGRLRLRCDAEIPYEASATRIRACRRIAWTRTLWRTDDLTSLLPLGQIGALAIDGEQYRCAFTPGLLGNVYLRPRHGQPDENLLPDPRAVLAPAGYLEGAVAVADGRFPASDPTGLWWQPSGRSYFTSADADPATELAWARAHFFITSRYRDPFGAQSSVDFDPYDLLPGMTTDALGNQTAVEVNDYRTLQPRLVRDPNGNRAEVAFDTQGRVAGAAVMGKVALTEGDSLSGFVVDLDDAALTAFFTDPRTQAGVLLGGASVRTLDDPTRFERSRRLYPDDPGQWQPVVTATLTRETHLADAAGGNSRVQVALSFADGLGHEVQSKVQAEPGAVVPGGPTVDPRWVATGWTIRNNKGQPVQRYEPFFTASHDFEFGVSVGVSPVLFYDPVGRVVATLQPDHTYSKVVFGAWQQTSYDANDTCAPRGTGTGDPRTDPDIAGLVAGLFAGQPASWATWYQQRAAGALGVTEQAAAAGAAAHADTPTTSWLDGFGRAIATLTRNRVVCPGHDLDGTAEESVSRVELDISGHRLLERDGVMQGGDALGRIVQRQDHDMLGRLIRQQSQEAGGRWLLEDVRGGQHRRWDSRGHTFRTVADALRRPVEHWVIGTSDASDQRTVGAERLVHRIVYGEAVADPVAANLRTRIAWQGDDSGRTVHLAYDFKGNLLRNSRQCLLDPAAIADWSGNPALSAEVFVSSSRYDALSRLVQQVAAHSGPSCAVTQRSFNEANLVQRIDVWLDRISEPNTIIDPTVEPPAPVGLLNVDYDPKGRRTRVDFANGVSTFHRYDPLTMRLVQLYTRRGAAFTTDCGNSQPPPATVAAPDQPPAGVACGVQNLTYTYDPVGNLSHIDDAAQQPVFFRNQRVESSNDYVYDACYRLIQASGREHLGQASAPVAYDPFDLVRIRLEHPGDGNAMARYVERYVYDPVGNFARIQHRGSDPAHPGWVRSYRYAEPSLTEDGSNGGPVKFSNRLSGTRLEPNGADPARDETYTYDPHGNVITMPHLGGGPAAPSMVWDYQDRLVEVDLGGGGRVYYRYDAAGERAAKIRQKSAGLTEERRYLGGSEIFRKHQGGLVDPVVLVRETLHVMDAQWRLALVETRTVDGAGNDPSPGRMIRYQHGNHLGSVSLELDDQARIISYEEYAPYGSTTYQAVRSQTETAKRYRFTGKERDEETGFSYHGARYYAPWLGRWISCDPGGLGDGPNLYQYCSASPVNLADPSGHQGENTNEDLFQAVRNQGAFEEGAARPQKLDLTAARTNAFRFGMAVQRRLEGVITQMRQAKVDGADRIFSEVAVNKSTGIITKVGGVPIRGHDNLDLTATPKGGPALGPGVPGNKKTIDLVGDVKVGRGAVTEVQASYGARGGVTVTTTIKPGPGYQPPAPPAANSPRPATFATTGEPEQPTPPRVSRAATFASASASLFALVAPAVIGFVSGKGADQQADAELQRQGASIEAQRTPTTGVLVVGHFRNTTWGDSAAGMTTTSFVSLGVVRGFATEKEAMEFEERQPAWRQASPQPTRDWNRYLWRPPLPAR